MNSSTNTKKASDSAGDLENPVAQDPAGPKPAASEPVSFEPALLKPDALEAAELHPGDVYMEGPYLVFTAQYHLRRGYCCNSDCRHCPYKGIDDGAEHRS